MIPTCAPLRCAAWLTPTKHEPASIVETLATENGKMKYEAGFEAHLIPRALRFAAGLAMHNFGRVAEIRPGVQSMSIREPVGVAGLIIPWNSPGKALEVCLTF